MQLTFRQSKKIDTVAAEAWGQKQKAITDCLNRDRRSGSVITKDRISFRRALQRLIKSSSHQ